MSLACNDVFQIDDRLQSEWWRQWREHQRFPDDYLCLHIIATDFDPLTGLILEVGICQVRNQEVAERLTWALDWAGEPSLSINQHPSPNAVPARQALDEILAVVRAALGRGEFLVGHNLWAFHLPIAHQHWLNRLGEMLEINGSQVLDTGLMEKASQIEAHPNDHTDLEEFWSSVRDRRAVGVHWSLRGHCVSKYGLVEDGTSPQPSLADACLTHLLLEKFRSLCG